MKFIYQKNIFFLLFALFLVLALSAPEGYLSLAEETKGGKIAMNCSEIPYGLRIEETEKLFDEYINYLTSLNEWGENNFLHASRLSYLAEDCKGRNCQGNCECPECLCCDPEICICFYCSGCEALPCSGGPPCNYSGIKKEYQKVFEANRKVRENLLELRALNVYLEELKRNLEETGEGFALWYNEERNTNLLLDCFEAKSLKAIEDCLYENNYYSCQ